MLKLPPRLRPCVLDATTAARLDGSDEVPAGASVVIVAGWLRERLDETSRAQCLPLCRRLARRSPRRRELLLDACRAGAWRLRRLLAGCPVGRYMGLADRIAAYGRERRSSRSQEAREAALMPCGRQAVDARSKRGGSFAARRAVPDGEERFISTAGT
jgi:hypothetical protein